MKLGDFVRKAVKERDAVQCSRIADMCRFKRGLNYKDTFKFVHRLTGIEWGEWEELLKN